MTWCDSNDRGLIQYVNVSKGLCDYTDKNWHGVLFSYFSDSDCFEIYNSCCSKEETRVGLNEFHLIDNVYDGRNSKRIIRFNFKGSPYARAFHNIIIEEYHPRINFVINTYYILPKSIITLTGREITYEDYPYFIIAESRPFTIKTSLENTLEYINLNYTWGFSPGVFIEGHIAVKLTNETIRNDCQYRYTSDQYVINRGVDNNNLQVLDICYSHNRHRMAICGRNVPITYQDCSCSYSNFEYENSAIDCSFLSKYLSFKIKPNQEFIPYEREWSTLITTGVDSKITIPKDSSMIFFNDVYLPNASLSIDGTCIFKGTIHIERSDVLYNLGHFQATSFEYGSIEISKDPVLFIGKCNSNLTECNKLLSNSNIKEVNCGGVLNRYLYSRSTLGCKCTQKDSTYFEQSDCSYLTEGRQNRMKLVLEYNYNSGLTKKYWSSISGKKYENGELIESITLEGSSIIVENECDFRNIKVIELKGSLRCGILYLSNTTKIIGYAGSSLRTYSIQIDNIVSNMNKEALIIMGDGEFISDGSMNKVLSNDQTECFELVSFNNEVSKSLDESTDGKYVSLVVGKMIRICPEGYNKDDRRKIICSVENGIFGNFKYHQCPCKGNECYYDLGEWKEITISSEKEYDIIDGNIIIINPNIIFNNVRSISSIQSNIIPTIQLNGNNNIISIKINTNKTMNIISNQNIYLSGNAEGVSIKTTKNNGNINIVGVYNQIGINTSYTTTITIENGNSIASINNQGGFDISNNSLIGNNKVRYSIDGRCRIGRMINERFICDSCGKDEIKGSCLENINVDNCLTYGITGRCIECQEKYYLSNNIKENEINQKCIYCLDSHCKRCSKEECYECEEGYKLEEGMCKYHDTNCKFYSNGYCKLCQNGEYVNNIQYCSECEINNCEVCKTHNPKQCEICSNGYYLNKSLLCEKININNETVNSGAISCYEGYYNDNGICKECKKNNEYGKECLECTNEKCHKCGNEYILNNKQCEKNTNEYCEVIKDSKCMKCKYGYYNPSSCTKCPKGCLSCYGTIENVICLECDNKNNLTLWLIDGQCKSQNQIFLLNDSLKIKEHQNLDKCSINQKGICIRCSDGYYEFNSNCLPCNSNCSSCLTTSTQCLSCSDSTKIVSNYECVSDEEFSKSCKQKTLSKVGCAICNDGYYRKGTSCPKCPKTMELCEREDLPIKCNVGYFMYHSKECRPKTELTNCVTIDSIGCSKCLDGYYVYDSYCFSCLDNCYSCSNSNKCKLCFDGFVLNGLKCVSYKTIEHCESSSNNVCTSCSRGFTIKGNICERKSMWWISLIVIPIFTLIIVMIYFILTLISKKIIRLKQDNTLNLKDLFSSEHFQEVLPGILVTNNKFTLVGDEYIPVNETTTLKLIIANHGKHKVKIQSSHIPSKKYQFTIQPNLVFLRQNKAIEITIDITPICSTTILQQIRFSVYNFKFNKEMDFFVDINIETEQTCILDPDELIQKKKIGEGSFGVVYKGEFKGNSVAIKRMKPKVNDSNSEIEFRKEVEMLAKFRCNYIIHFYGAVIIQDNKCMVTEYAKYGSVQKMIESKPSNSLSKSIKIKMLLDIARGIEYLHNNGILHRDIKPDNMLITSLDNDIPVNAKLTDFGSARNINSLMTNMTFTKGVGTPSFMAPEILKRKKYKTAADIYSFAISIYSVMIWENPYPKQEFEYPWVIATFVASGHRRPQNNLPDYVYKLICECWCDEPTNRLNIEQTIKQLEIIQKSIQSKHH
ncbi:tyrosine kinase, putative [Entamoeba nuttalli P19]|uniref:Tyrosine kinase, putative n=2 Tax=Entamoeba nuttalli TaxID=412467 RepID=K2HFI1_ENTNP|nr:tyrosine kinase, putative [Entamoeba nuttalli P19]EKE41584.1 tyrosine kinase, putative [Entamoeba nuttalli P19]|eukprot:XP_008856093.1 tyrosine kinase, putative [Entamoeba nuttalli P19]